MSNTTPPNKSSFSDMDIVNPSSVLPERSSISAWQKSRKIIISTSICIWMSGLIYTFAVFKPVYQSKATVLIRDSAITGKLVTNEDYHTTSSPSANPVLNTIELLKSNVIRESLWTRVIQSDKALMNDLKIENKEEWGQFYGDGRKLIKYNNPPGTDVIQLTFNWDNPELAQRCLSVVLEGFQDASRQLNKEEHKERYRYLQERISNVQSQLMMTREFIANVKSTNRIVDINHEMEQYAKYHMEFKLASSLAKAESMQNSSKLQAYTNTLKMAPSMAVDAIGMGSSPAMQALVNKLYHEKEQLSELQSRYTDEHPKVKSVTSSINQLNVDINNEAKRLGISPDVTVITDEHRGRAIENMLEVNSSAKGSAQRSEALNRDLDRLENRMKELPKIEGYLAKLKDSEESLASSVKALQAKALEAQIREDQTLSNIFIVSPPDFPQSAKLPTRTHMLILTFLAGLLGGLAVMKFRTSSIKLPALAEVWPLDTDVKKAIELEKSLPTSPFNGK